MPTGVPPCAALAAANVLRAKTTRRRRRVVNDADIRLQCGVVDDGAWLYRELGQRIRDARLHAGLTQSSLALSAGLSRTSITNIEMGNQQPTIHALWRIADAVSTSPCDLLPEWPRSTERGGALRLPADVPAATLAALERIAGKARGR